MFSVPRTAGTAQRERMALFLALLTLHCSGFHIVCVAAETPRGVRFTDLAVPEKGKTGFSLVEAAATGLNFTNHVPATSVAGNRILDNGSGVALGDVDGDGLCDIYLCRLEGANLLYRNLGNWKFDPFPESSRVACGDDRSTGAVLADLDGDGHLDLLANSIGGGTRCFFNDGSGRFTESTESGFQRRYGAMSLTVADIDGDSDLDVYVANYRTTNFKDAPPGVKVEFLQGGGRVIARPEDRFFAFMKGTSGIQFFERGEADILYRNDGNRRFTAVPWTQGQFLDADGQALTEPPRFWGLSAMFRDINGDNAPDLYVCNDFAFSFDSSWLNDGRGGFRAMPRLALREMSMSSMGVDFADIDRDGYVDFFVADMLSREHQRRQRQRVNVHPDLMNLSPGVFDDRPEVMRNTLFLNRGDNTFAEIARFSGLEASEWSWCPVFLDVDLDGFEDLLVTTGNGHDVIDSDANAQLEQLNRTNTSGKKIRALEHIPPLRTPNLAFRNRGDLTFQETGQEWGFNLDGVSQGMALADLDNDGDLDVVVNNLNDRASLYRNDTAMPRIGIRLKGVPPNTRGIGAKISVIGGPVSQSQEMISGGRYLSSDDSMRVFATGSSDQTVRVEITWRSGKVTILDEVKGNQICEIQEERTGNEKANPGTPSGEATFPSQDSLKKQGESALPFFQDVSHLIQHSHHEEPFDDFVRQPLLPRRLSQTGPGVGWHDYDGDGLEDLIIGSGRGGIPGVYRNRGAEGFERFDEAPINRVVPRDQTSVIGFDSNLVFGAANYEDGSDQGGCIRIYDLGRRVAGDSIMGPTSSTGPLAMADIDGDGDLDLFIGGRVKPGRYPAPADSLLMRNDGGRFVVEKKWEQLGLASGAVFSDLNGDGKPDLIIACEWGPLRVFLNRDGDFTEATSALGFDTFSGWWNGVTTGDFDGDGRMDIAASNWGRNTEFERHRDRGLQIYYGDFDSNGVSDLIETYVDQTRGKIVPRRGFETLSATLPFVAQRFSDFRSFASATVEDILGDALQSAGTVQASWLDSTVFLNRGDRFEARSLPAEAQWAPAFGLCVGDFDGDGMEDIFLAQNFFANEPEISRNDAGRGLWLRGEGDGTFKPVPGQKSGVRIYGEQRGCALADFDADGRVDLVVGQNAAATKLFRNVTGKRGLRIRLKGPSGNPTAAGALIRLIAGERNGPAREIHIGEGYWSQDGAIKVMAMPEKPTEIWVRWPGGKETLSALDSIAREIEIEPSGKVRVVR